MNSLYALAKRLLRTGMVAVMLVAVPAVLSACADIHPDNSPHSPSGHGR